MTASTGLVPVGRTIPACGRLMDTPLDDNKLIYTSENTRTCFRLHWSLALFWRTPVPERTLTTCMEDVKPLAEGDGIRILEHCMAGPNVSLFLLSTGPALSPADVVRTMKGRLQHAVRKTQPKAFRRNYFITSVGTSGRRLIEGYVASQAEHHRMADDRVQEALVRCQMVNSDVDLAVENDSAHGRYIHNLHLVFVNAERWRDVREDQLRKNNETILRVSRAEGHRVSRIGVFSDHVHIALGCGVNDAPSRVALCYMNALAHSQGSVPVYQCGYYAGTFGEYSMEAIRRRLRDMPP